MPFGYDQKKSINSMTCAYDHCTDVGFDGGDGVDAMMLNLLRRRSRRM